MDILRKYSRALALVLFLAFFAAAKAVAMPDDWDYDDDEQEDLPPIKVIFGNVGYGSYNWFGGVGFRWWVFGASLGFSALDHGSKPAIKNFTRENPAPKETEYDPLSRESMTTLIVDANFYYYLKLSKKITGFASMGFYAQKDSVFRYKYYEPGVARDRYYWKTENKTGFCMSFGAQYYYREDFMLGVGFHTKNGFFATLGYHWF